MITATSLDRPTSTSGVAPNAFSELTSEEFVKIMFTELSNQDPLKPSDSSALLQQMSNLRSIQSDIERDRRDDRHQDGRNRRDQRKHGNDAHM